MRQLQELHDWYMSLQQRERQLVLAASGVILATLFYLIIWEPVHKSLDEQSRQYRTQTGILQWMQDAANEVRTLKVSGGARKSAGSTQPVTLLVEMTATTAGLKPYVTKLESTTDKGARVTIDGASFDQLLLWLNTMQTKYGISVTSANIDRDDKLGAVKARMTFNRD